MHDNNLQPRGRWPRWWRMVVVGVSTLALCSCQSTNKPPLPGVNPTAAKQQQAEPASAPAQPEAVVAQPEAVVAQPEAVVAQPEAAVAEAVASSVMTDPAIRRVAAQSPEYPARVAPAPRIAQARVAPVAAQAPPFPEQVIGPPARAVYGVPQPPPEYLCDGGDRDLPARVSPEWLVQGLEPEDTIGHADTLDGRVIVAPSNRVKIYAPRFAAVRSVVDLRAGRTTLGIGRHNQRIGLEPLSDAQGPNIDFQNQRALGDVVDRGPQGFRSEAWAGADLTVDKVTGVHGGLLPFEDMALISRGVLENSDKPLLAIGKQAAVTWAHDLGVQVAIKGIQPSVVNGDQRTEAVFAFEDKSGPAKLRIVKIASKSFARVGDEIDFTIRFDNVGDQLIGNVTILDNLTTRLEYIPDSARSSHNADFATKENEAGSMVLRWDLVDPLPKGDGGVVRFKCRVR